MIAARICSSVSVAISERSARFRPAVFLQFGGAERAVADKQERIVIEARLRPAPDFVMEGGR
jgi:hypothetical protein